MNIIIVKQEMFAKILGISVFCAILSWCATFTAAVFEDNKVALSYFELLDYDPRELLSQHERIRRGAPDISTIRFSFYAFNRTYNFLLAPVDWEGGGVFAREFVATINGRQETLDLDVHYRGSSLDDPSMTIFGGVTLGYFTGVIHGESEELFIEPAHRFFGPPSMATGYHSIVYRLSDVDPHYSNGTGCGVSHDHSSVLPTSASVHTKNSRAAFDPSKTICNLLIIVDERFYASHTSSGLSERQRMVQACAFVAEVVQGVNEIFYSTDFDGTQGIRFVISNLTILTEAPPGFEPSNIGHERYLTLHSQENYTQYCLAYRITSRVFDGGVLGFAYVNNGDYFAGICAQFNGGTTYNTGMVTVNYFGGQTVPMAQVMLALAHEFGHNFGSDHDPLPCQPESANGGKYIMYASAVRGDNSNNRMFSSCSKMDMGLSIRTVGQDAIRGCFQNDRGLCGNRIIDTGEVCDCGFFTGTCPDDPCCVADTCQLQDGVVCSPQQGPCCHDNCTYRGSEALCAEEAECSSEQFCNSTQAACPLAPPKNENETCQDGRYLCQNGFCNGSLCVLFNLLSCLCEVENSCDVCCYLDGQCQSMAAQLQQMNASLSHHLGPGAACIGQTTRGRRFDDGYCDALHRCREIDPDDAIVNQLLSLLRNYTSVAEWMRTMWWLVVLACVAVLLVLISIVTVCHFSLRKADQAKEARRNRPGVRGRAKARPTRVIPLRSRRDRVSPIT